MMENISITIFLNKVNAFLKWKKWSKLMQAPIAIHLKFSLAREFVLFVHSQNFHAFMFDILYFFLKEIKTINKN